MCGAQGLSAATLPWDGSNAWPARTPPTVCVAYEKNHPCQIGKKRVKHVCVFFVVVVVVAFIMPRARTRQLPF